MLANEEGTTEPKKRWKRALPDNEFRNQMKLTLNLPQISMRTSRILGERQADIGGGTLKSGLATRLGAAPAR
jgi:hypothetical protein